MNLVYASNSTFYEGTVERDIHKHHASGKKRTIQENKAHETAEWMMPLVLKVRKKNNREEERCTQTERIKIS